MIINIFTIVGGSGAEKKAGSGEVRCVAGTAPALLQSGVRRHFSRIIISQWNCANHSFRVFFRESDSYHVISKYKQSDWFSRFLVMLSQQAQYFGRSAPDPYPL